MIRMEVQGMERIQRKLKEIPRVAAKTAEKAIVEFAQAVMSEAQKRVPVVTGQLRSSAYVRQVKRNQHRSDVRFGYDAPYAIYVHEIPYSGHTTRGKPGALRNGQGYKWLARAYQHVLGKAKSRVTQTIAQAVKRMWQGG